MIPDGEYLICKYHSTSYEGSAEEGAGEHENGAEHEEPSVSDDDEPDVVAAVHVQRVRGVAPLDERALKRRNRFFVGIFYYIHPSNRI